MMKRTIALLLALLFVFSLAACGEKEEETEKQQQQQTEADAAAKYATLQEYIDDPVNLQGLDEMKKSGAEVMEIDVKADGSTLVYDYKYKTVMEADALPEVKSALEETLQTSEASFVQMAQTIQSQIKEDINMKVVYRNGDGEVIIEKTIEP